jgi:demethylmenaquinone methyltransferase / 2-methoxy-6-polyprenyl-1,4-benzoquinol methylase
MPDSQQVKNLFKTVAPRYDFINSLLSLGFDGLWRKALVRSILFHAPGKLLDIACGSGRVLRTVKAISRASRQAAPELTGVDFCPELLALAKADPHLREVHFQEADALNLPFAEGSFDALSVAWGLRNFADRPRFYAEALRVISPGGRLYILEFSQPYALFRPLYRLYQLGIPLLARLCGAPREAYAYLNRSINAFPSAPKLAEELRAAGWRDVAFRRLTFGVVALHVAQK